LLGVYADYTLTPTPIDYYINTENNTEQESNSGESSVSEEQKKKRRKVTMNMVPFIAEKGDYMPPSCSFAEVRGSLEKLFNLGNSRDGGWKDDKSKEAFESLLQGVEHLYNSCSTSEAFTAWWGAGDVDAKQWWNALRITPMERFIEHFEANPSEIWTTERTDEQARAHKKYTWKLVTHQDQLLPKERYLCKLDRGAFSVLQSLCVPHTNTKWVAQSVGFGNLYTLSKLRSRKSTGGSGKGQTLAVKDSSGRSSDIGLLVYLFCLSKYICSVHYLKGNPEATSQEKQGTVPGVTGNLSSETSAQISGNLQQQQCRTTARVLYKEFLFRGIYSSPEAFLRYLFGCLEEECDDLGIAMPTTQEILQWLKEDKVLFKSELEQNCELHTSPDKSNTAVLHLGKTQFECCFDADESVVSSSLDADIGHNVDSSAITNNESSTSMYSSSGASATFSAPVDEDKESEAANSLKVAENESTRAGSIADVCIECNVDSSAITPGTTNESSTSMYSSSGASATFSAPVDEDKESEAANSLKVAENENTRAGNIAVAVFVHAHIPTADVLRGEKTEGKPIHDETFVRDNLRDNKAEEKPAHDRFWNLFLQLLRALLIAVFAIAFQQFFAKSLEVNLVTDQMTYLDVVADAEINSIAQKANSTLMEKFGVLLANPYMYLDRQEDVRTLQNSTLQGTKEYMLEHLSKHKKDVFAWNIVADKVATLSSQMVVADLILVASQIGNAWKILFFSVVDRIYFSIYPSFRLFSRKN
jgi:hypothetical protein